MRDKQFIINSIKMDLHRVVTAAGDITKDLPQESVEEFLTHALKDLEKLELNERESNLKKILEDKKISLSSVLYDPHQRLRWTEDVMTVRNRL